MILCPKLLYCLRKCTKSSKIRPRGAVPPWRNNNLPFLVNFGFLPSSRRTLPLQSTKKQTYGAPIVLVEAPHGAWWDKGNCLHHLWQHSSFLGSQNALQILMLALSVNFLMDLYMYFSIWQLPFERNTNPLFDFDIWVYYGLGKYRNCHDLLQIQYNTITRVLTNTCNGVITLWIIACWRPFWI